MKKSILVLIAATLPYLGALSSLRAETPVAMPTVSAPSIGSGFYAPGSADFYGPSSPSAISRPASPKSPASPKATPRVKPSAAAKVTDSAPQNSALLAVADSAAEKLAAAQNGLSGTLTASDISSLGNLGYFRNLSGLLGLSRSESQNSGAVDLESVLSQLNDLKSKVDEKDRSPDVLKASFSNQNEAESRILRFSINGYDMNKTIKTVYFSKEESDGTFLLTGDRIYYADGANRTETFYILFKTMLNDEGVTKYKITSSVSQEYENPNSFLSKLSVLSADDELIANRTGNFVTMKFEGDDFKMDLLLGLER
ncbi:MAG: hypothetical protein IJP61_11985 [Treponema sp.]|nr:hypothetical protein [Treponema sp.]